MSLLKRNKDKQLSIARELAAQHAIVKIGADRNVRDAYFHGLVFAAVANDDQIDGSERVRLLELGEALELATDDVVEAIQCLSDMGDDAKMDVIEESARQLMNVDVAECFLKEFEEIWTIGGGNKGELDEFKSQLIEWMGDDVMAAEETKAKVAAEAETRRIAEEAETKAREFERQRKIDAERRAEEERIKAESAKQQFYTNVSDWLSKNARSGHLPENWKKILREKYDTSSLDEGFLKNVYHVLMRRMKNLLPVLNSVIDTQISYDDGIWKVVLTRMSRAHGCDTSQHKMFLILCQMLILLSHGEDFLRRFVAGPLLLMKADENCHIVRCEWIDRMYSEDYAEWFWLKGKYVKCMIGEFRWDKYHMERTEARKFAKMFYNEIVKQIELMYADLV